jgi:hypothetical protein
MGRIALSSIARAQEKVSAVGRFSVSMRTSLDVADVPITFLFTAAML